MTKIKICGLKRPEDIDYVNEAGPDYCGFIINVPGSPRTLPPSAVQRLCRRLKEGIKPVGVFVNALPEEILDLALNGTIKVIQLHGRENDAFIERIKALTSLPVIKAYSVSDRDDLLKAAESPADYILLDHGAGGTGKSFEWSLLTDFNRPYFLAGGLTPENLPEAVKRFHPFAVDLSSGVETDGYKDREKILAAMAAVRSTKL